jgi:hypothetical protein
MEVKPKGAMFKSATIDDVARLTVSGVAAYLRRRLFPWVAKCARCREQMTVSGAGELFTEDCDPVCDACGEKDAPEAMKIARALRARADDEFTISVGGARIDEDELAWNCAVCQCDIADDDEIFKGWHVVDQQHGRPVCRSCVSVVDDSLRELAMSANALEAHA